MPFPTTPADGQVHVEESLQFQFRGTSNAWVRHGAGFSGDLTGLADPALAGYAPTDYPEGFVYLFINGVTGSEMWVVLASETGVMRWRRVSFE